MKKVMPESTRMPVVPKNTCALTLVNIFAFRSIVAYTQYTSK